jgi:hypothetical protein
VSDIDTTQDPEIGGLTNLERAIAVWREDALRRLPAHVRALGAILRRSVRTGRTNALGRWCRKHGFAIARKDLSRLRDYLITQMIDLKELEPDARARLRLDTLGAEDPSSMTPDYRDGIARGRNLRCRDCRWFVKAPRDGDVRDPDSTKSCVELGTKGADRACFGFERSSAG